NCRFRPNSMCRIPDIGYSSISNRDILICLQFFCMYINQCTIFDNCFSFFLALRNLYKFVINLIYWLIQMDFLLFENQRSLATFSPDSLSYFNVTIFTLSKALNE